MRILASTIRFPLSIRAQWTISHGERERETERVYRQLIEVIRFSENAFRGAEAIL